MIHFFATDDHGWMVDRFIASWAPELDPLIRRRAYERMRWRGPLESGTCIFADLERLLPLERPMVRAIADELRKHPDDFLLLNDPARYLGRFALLQALHARGLNDFRAWRLSEIGPSIRFPVFLRSDSDHAGPIGGLIESRDELERVVAGLPFWTRFQREQLMVVEYCDCADASGVFRKYSVMNVNGTFVPRHLLFSRNWVTKEADLVNDSTAEEERAFLASPPHRDQIAEAYRLAGVDYGRIDYGVKDGRVQVWEINTNPVLVPVREKIHPDRFAAQAESAAQIARELRKLADCRGHRELSPFRGSRTRAWPFVQAAVRYGRPCWKWARRKGRKISRFFSATGST